MTQEEQLKEALRVLENYVYTLAEYALAEQTPEQRKEYAKELWERMSKSPGVLQEFSYYHDYGKFLCRYQVEGYTVADILVWQVDHFKAYMDRPQDMNRYHSEKLLLAAFDILLQMEENPQPYLIKMRDETGTDFEEKYP